MKSEINLSQIFENVIQSKSFPPSSSFLVSVSGGVDSMVLLDLFRKSGKKIGVFHFNHQTRPIENDNEANLINLYCSKHNILFHYESWKTKPKTGNFQENARNERKKRLLKIAKKIEYNFISTAHHLDDQIETQFQRILKGASLTNLSGMTELENVWFKPLLSVHKEDILSYAKRHRVKFLEDSSNYSDNYERNRLRHHFIPELKSEFGNRLTSSLENLSIQSSLLNYNAETFYQAEKENIVKQSEDGFEIEFGKHQPYFEFLEILFLKLFFENQFKLIIGFPSASEIYNFSKSAERGKSLSVFKNISIRKLASGIRVSVLKSVEKEKSNLKVLVAKTEKPKKIFAGNKIVLADEDKIKFPLTIRYWKNGDKFQPLGLKQKIKLSDFFINRKIELHQKKSVPLIADNGGNIIWIYGLEISDTIKITNETSHYIKLELEGV